MTDIVFLKPGDQRTLSKFSSDVIRDIAAKASVPHVTVTRMQSTAREQAVAMFHNCATLGVASQYKLYGPFGDKVVDVYAGFHARGRVVADEVIAAMTAEIVKLGPSNVSHHCADPSVLNVVDISHSAMPADKHRAFESAIVADARVSRHFSPYTEPTDPAFHLEIPQPKAAAAAEPVEDESVTS
jgi:hypothetical protein